MYQHRRVFKVPAGCARAWVLFKTLQGPAVSRFGLQPQAIAAALGGEEISAAEMHTLIAQLNEIAAGVDAANAD